MPELFGEFVKNAIFTEWKLPPVVQVASNGGNVMQNARIIRWFRRKS